MNIAIGFGSTETNFETALERQLSDFLDEHVAPMCPDYFTDEGIEAARVYLDVRATELQARNKVNDKLPRGEAPARYSNIYPYVLGDASYIVAIVGFGHISRDHAMSPDGWAYLGTERVLKFSHRDLKKTAAER